MALDTIQIRFYFCHCVGIEWMKWTQHLLSCCHRSERGRRRSWRKGARPVWQPSSTLIWRRLTEGAAKVLWGFFLVFALLFFFFFTFSHDHLRLRYHKVKPLLTRPLIPVYSLLGAERPQKQVLKAASFSSFLACYLSLLSLVYLCQLRV